MAVTLQASLLPANLKKYHPEFETEPPLGVIAYEPTWRSSGYSWEGFPKEGTHIFVPIWYLLQPRKVRLPSIQERFLAMFNAALFNRRDIKLPGKDTLRDRVSRTALDEALALYRKKLDSP